jgi:hypothetical protein
VAYRLSSHPSDLAQCLRRATASRQPKTAHATSLIIPADSPGLDSNWSGRVSPHGICKVAG